MTIYMLEKLFFSQNNPKKRFRNILGDFMEPILIKMKK